jgi:hypothetical protein
VGVKWLRFKSWIQPASPPIRLHAWSPFTDEVLLQVQRRISQVIGLKGDLPVTSPQESG